MNMSDSTANSMASPHVQNEAPAECDSGRTTLFAGGALGDEAIQPQPLRGPVNRGQTTGPTLWSQCLDPRGVNKLTRDPVVKGRKNGGGRTKRKAGAVGSADDEAQPA